MTERVDSSPVPLDLDATQLTSSVAHHGEGAWWDGARSRWLWVDMLAGRLFTTELDGTTNAFDVPDSIAAFVRPVVPEGLVLVGERTIWFSNTRSPDRAWERLLDLPIRDGCRVNEGAISPDGGLVVGTMAYDAAPTRGRVFAIDLDASVSLVVPACSVANGTVFIADDRVLFTDSPTRRVVQYAIAAGDAWSAERTIVDTTGEDGVPDGICVDSDGGVWVAMWDGAAVIRWSPTGELTHRVLLPVRRPTSVALGGADLCSLFITTSALELPEGHGTEAGAAFVVRVETPGLQQPGLPASTVESWRRTGGVSAI